MDYGDIIDIFRIQFQDGHEEKTYLYVMLLLAVSFESSDLLLRQYGEVWVPVIRLVGDEARSLFELPGPAADAVIDYLRSEFFAEIVQGESMKAYSGARVFRIEDHLVCASYAYGNDGSNWISMSLVYGPGAVSSAREALPWYNQLPLFKSAGD